MKKLIYIPLVLAYVLQWTFTVLTNLMEVISVGFEEIILALQKYTSPDAETKPDGSQVAATASKGD